MTSRWFVFGPELLCLLRFVLILLIKLLESGGGRTRFPPHRGDRRLKLQQLNKPEASGHRCGLRCHLWSASHKTTSYEQQLKRWGLFHLEKKVEGNRAPADTPSRRVAGAAGKRPKTDVSKTGRVRQSRTCSTPGQRPIQLRCRKGGSVSCGFSRMFQE